METLPVIVPVFPLARALLLPGGSLPLVIFENRYLAMLKEALAGERVIAMSQPKTDERVPALYNIGCLGRITSFNEIEDGRMLITLTGLSRFKLVRELSNDKAFRTIEINYENFPRDLEPERNEKTIDRDGLLSTVRRYLEKNSLQADWDAINQASSSSLVTAFSILSPYGVAEKQALLEARDAAERCNILIALTEMVLAQHETLEGENQDNSGATQPTLQ
jgi:Lon protease-like protein